MYRPFNPGVSPNAPMFRVDHQVFTGADCERILAPWLALPIVHQPASQRIAVCLQETGHWLAFCLFCRQQGISVLPIHPGTPRAAACTLANASQCTHLLYADRATPDALETLDNPPVTESAPGGELIQMSSGTTGQPKTLRRPWQDIDGELTAYVAHFTEASELTPVIACPVSHSYGLICGVLAALKRGSIPQVATNLNPRSLLATLRDTPEHLLYASPTLISLLVRLLPASQRLHTVMLSGAPLPETVMAEVKTRTQRLCQQYGCSEIGCIALTADTDGPGHLGTALPHLEVTAGTPEAPAEILVQARHGSGVTIATRDLGYFDCHGQLHFTARMDDTINVAGINVYPGDVESVVLSFPGVREAVAFKQPDTLAGERVALAVVDDENLDTNELRHWCRERLSPHQMPAVIHQMASIPTLPNGKISRRHLARFTVKQAEVSA
ncbi:MAG: AMP-binding protein [Pseudomonadota bacterium]|nr:AMP-binding protein [Pseudomonadota bacterium]